MEGVSGGGRIQMQGASRNDLVPRSRACRWGRKPRTDRALASAVKDSIETRRLKMQLHMQTNTDERGGL